MERMAGSRLTGMPILAMTSPFLGSSSAWTSLAPHNDYVLRGGQGNEDIRDRRTEEADRCRSSRLPGAHLILRMSSDTY